MKISRRRWFEALSYGSRNWRQFRGVGNAAAKSLVDLGYVVVQEGKSVKLEEAMSATLALGAGLKKTVFRVQGMLAGAGITYLLVRSKNKKVEE
jgi:hypothetical protein